MVEIDSPADQILIATDGSPAAKAAAGLAIQLAQQWRLPIVGIYVVDDALVTNTYSNYAVELGTDALPSSRGQLVEWFRTRGDAELGWLENASRIAGLAVSTELLLGDVHEGVLRRADDTTLLALGRRGLGHMGDQDHLGRHFKAIAHSARQPLLVGDAAASTVERLLLAYEGGRNVERALTWAGALQRTLGAELIVTAGEAVAAADRLSEAQPRLEAHGLHDYRLVSQNGPPAEQIIATAAESCADLIIVERYHHPDVLEWLTGSIADRVLLGTRLPVLIA